MSAKRVLVFIFLPLFSFAGQDSDNEDRELITETPTEQRASHAGLIEWCYRV